MKIKSLQYLIPVLDQESKAELLTLERPTMVGKKKTPENLDLITFGQFIELQGIKTDQDHIYKPCRVLLNMSDREIQEAEHRQVIGFSNFVVKEIIRIADLFSETNIPPTQEEIQAGVEDLKFGVFGIIDYYAQRMKLSDHDAVLDTGWIRIYQCMKIDTERSLFERRLRKVLEQQNNRK